MTEYLQPRDIDEFADQIQTNYLECRIHGHQRQPSNVALLAPSEAAELHLLGTDKYAVKTLRCRNLCGVIWREIVNLADGSVTVPSTPDYSAAPLYLAKGLGRLGKPERNRLRLEQLRRWLEAQAKKP